MMRISRLGVFVLLILVVSLGSSCSFYNRVMARKNLVDGAKAYKDRKFPEAEERFRYAASLDPEGDTLEGRVAQLSLARTLHSEYIGDRGNKGKAQAALDAYKKSLPQSLKEYKDTYAAYTANPNSEDAQKKYFGSLSAVNSTTSAIASLYDNLEQPDKGAEWQQTVANDESYPAAARARAFSSMAAKQNTCANDISDTPETKKTITGKDGKQAYQFVKPANEADFAKLKQCAADGSATIAKAMALEPAEVKNAASIDPKKLNDAQLALDSEILKVFESVRSYNSALKGQLMRIAEMEGNTADHDRYKQEYEQAKDQFSSLSDIVKKIQDEIDARAAAKDAAEHNASNANANAESNANTPAANQ